MIYYGFLMNFLARLKSIYLILLYLPRKGQLDDFIRIKMGKLKKKKFRILIFKVYAINF